jgi:hypothetical protein
MDDLGVSDDLRGGEFQRLADVVVLDRVQVAFHRGQHQMVDRPDVREALGQLVRAGEVEAPRRAPHTLSRPNREGDAREPFGQGPQLQRRSGVARGGGPADQGGVAALFEDTVRAHVRRAGQVGGRRVQGRQRARARALPDEPADRGARDGRQQAEVPVEPGRGGSGVGRQRPYA